MSELVTCGLSFGPKKRVGGGRKDKGGVLMMAQFG